MDRAKVSAGHKALVHAGAGGVGYVAIQIAQAFGAKAFATVSAGKRRIVEELGAVAIDYREQKVEEYVEAKTGGSGFDIVYDTVGGETLDQSFAAVKLYTGHVLSSVGWGTHALAPLSIRAATYSGVFTLLPLLTGKHRAHHGHILARVAGLADAGKLRPFLSSQTFSMQNIEEAYTLVAAGSMGKVVVSAD